VPFGLTGGPASASSIAGGGTLADKDGLAEWEHVEAPGLALKGKALRPRLSTMLVLLTTWMDEWLGRPSVGRRPDLCSRKSAEKTGENRRSQHAYTQKLTMVLMTTEAVRHRSRRLQSNRGLSDNDNREAAMCVTVDRSFSCSLLPSVLGQLD